MEPSMAANQGTTGATGPSAAEPRPVTILTCTNCGTRNKIRPNPRGAPHCARCGKALPWVVNADEKTFEVEIKAAPTVVVDLWAPWCGPCRIVGPMLEELAREYAGRLKVVKVNVDENPRLSARFNAMSIPTMIVMREGRDVDRIVGAMPKPALDARLAGHLQKARSATA
jgi:thioredoxin 2